jgi:WD40 repeat protein
MHSSGLIDKNRCGTSRVPASESNLAPFSFSADGNLLVSRYNESYRVWDIRNQKQLIKLDSLGRLDFLTKSLYNSSLFLVIKTLNQLLFMSVLAIMDIYSLDGIMATFKLTL